MPIIKFFAEILECTDQFKIIGFMQACTDWIWCGNYANQRVKSQTWQMLN